MIIVNGVRYYRLQEAAELAGVNVRTLRRWIAGGNLSHFLFPYRQGGHSRSPVYYRLEPPDETDELWEGESVYKLPDPGKDEETYGAERTTKNQPA